MKSNQDNYIRELNANHVMFSKSLQVKIKRRLLLLMKPEVQEKYL